MNSGHDAHRRSTQMASYAKQTEAYQQSKDKAKKGLSEKSSTHIQRNPFWFEKLWRKWFKKS